MLIVGPFLLLEIGFGLPPAESKKLKNHIKADPCYVFFWASSLVPPKCLWPPLMGAASFDFKEKETELDHYRPNY